MREEKKIHQGAEKVAEEGEFLMGRGAVHGIAVGKGIQSSTFENQKRNVLVEGENPGKNEQKESRVSPTAHQKSNRSNVNGKARKIVGKESGE